MTINIEKMDANYLGVACQHSYKGLASKAISTVDRAINHVSSQRAALGAVQNRLAATRSITSTPPPRT